MPRSCASMPRGRAARPGVVAVVHGGGSRRLLAAGAAARAAAADPGHGLQPAHARCRWPRTRCATSASRSPWSSRRAATSPRTRCRDIDGRLRAAAGGGGSRGGARARRAAGARGPALNVAAHVPQKKGDYAAAQRARPTSVIRRRFRYDRGASAAIENRGVVAAVGRAGRPADGLGHHPGADPRSATAWPRMLGLSEHQVRVDRAVHRRRLRPEDHDVLSGGGADPLGRDAARSGRSNGSRTGWRTSSPPRRSADRSTTPRSRSTRDGRILGVQDAFLHDTGAYDPYGLTVPLNSQCTLLGPYDVPSL